MLAFLGPVISAAILDYCWTEVLKCLFHSGRLTFSFSLSPSPLYLLSALHPLLPPLSHILPSPVPVSLLSPLQPLSTLSPPSSPPSFHLPLQKLSSPPDSRGSDFASRVKNLFASSPLKKQRSMSVDALHQKTACELRESRRGRG